ncbi:MAG: hypothetical protein GX060_09605 [Firmicutes bacterium]|nr:hypothetical protein [Bacillota bacterium]
MKTTTIRKLLMGEAVICVLAVILLRLFTTATWPQQTLSFLLTIPFAQIGQGLRKLSLADGAYNYLALAIYVGLCLTPLLIIIRIRRRRRLQWEDMLLGTLSPVLFVALYYAINPGLLSHHNSVLQLNGMAFLGNIAYSVTFGYIVLRVLRGFFTADNIKLHKYLAVLLGLLGALFVLSACGIQLSTLFDALTALRLANTGAADTLAISYLFLFLRYLVRTLPTLMNVVVILALLHLLEEHSADSYSTATVNAIEKVANLSRITLAASVVANVGFNLLQLVCVRHLRTIDGLVQVPITSLAFTVGALVLAQILKEGKELKDDNLMFI